MSMLKREKVITKEKKQKLFGIILNIVDSQEPVY